MLIAKSVQIAIEKGVVKSGRKSRTYSVSLRSDIHQRQKEFQETEHFKELATIRYYDIEAQNSEIKHRHGYDVASSSGLKGMEIQGALRSL